MKTKDIELKGDAIESLRTDVLNSFKTKGFEDFEKVEKIEEIILLGIKGGVRRIIIR